MINRWAFVIARTARLLLASIIGGLVVAAANSGSIAHAVVPGSLCFNGSSYLGVTLPAIDSGASHTDFTVEAWVKVPATLSHIAPLIGTNGLSWYSGPKTGYTFFVNGVPGGSNGQMGFNGVGDTGSSNNPIPANTWFHTAYVRQNGLGTIYLNGVPQANATGLTDLRSYTNSLFNVGKDGLGFFEGCISNFVVANTALYTSDFSANLPYPASMTMPTGAGLYINPISTDTLATWNKGSGSSLSALSGSVTFNADYPVKPLINAIPAISASAANLTLGQGETLTATVVAGATGSVVFKDALGNALCTSSSLDNSGIGSCRWTPTSVGTYVVKAYYSGDSGYNPTVSASTSIIVSSTLIYSANGGTGSAPTSVSYSGTPITLPAGTGLSKSGYDFGGWAITESGTAVNSPYSPSSNLTLYAVWSPHSYSITFNPNGGYGSQASLTYMTGSSPTNLPISTTFTVRVIPSVAGAQFQAEAPTPPHIHHRPTQPSMLNGPMAPTELHSWPMVAAGACRWKAARLRPRYLQMDLPLQIIFSQGGIHLQMGQGLHSVIYRAIHF